jgi:hypothetical protein
LEKVDSFQYLGRILAQDDNNVRAVRSQIKMAQGIWARVGQILQADNTPPKVSAKFYKAVVQSVLLYGSKKWNLLTTTLERLEGSISVQHTAWLRNTSQQRDCIMCGSIFDPATCSKSAGWEPSSTILASGGEQIFSL